MQLILTVLHLVLALGLIGLILIQHGKGADAGAAFGSGASATVFGAQGSGSFLSRTTAIIATLFFCTSIALAYYAARLGEPAGLMDGIDEEAPIAIPSVVPAAPEADNDLPPAALEDDGPMMDTTGSDLPPVDAADLPGAVDDASPSTDMPRPTEEDVPSASQVAGQEANGSGAEPSSMGDDAGSDGGREQ